MESCSKQGIQTWAEEGISIIDLSIGKQQSGGSRRTLHFDEENPNKKEKKKSTKQVSKQATCSMSRELCVLITTTSIMYIKCRS